MIHSPTPELVASLKAGLAQLRHDAALIEDAIAKVTGLLVFYGEALGENVTEAGKVNRPEDSPRRSNISKADIRTPPESPASTPSRSDLKRAITAEREKEIASACKNTAMTTVAERFGISVGTVRRYRHMWPELSADDPEEEPEEEEEPEAPAGPTRDEIRAAKEAEAADLYESGRSVEEIAAAVGVCKATVFNWKRAGNWDRGKGHADRQIDRWEQGRAVVGDPDKVQTPPESRSKSQTAPLQPEIAKSPIGQFEHNGKSAPIEEGEEEPTVTETPGRIFQRSDPPPRSFEPGSEPGWISLPHRMPEPERPLARVEVLKQTPTRRCGHCQALTDCDPCHVCSRGWRPRGLLSERSA